MSKHITASGNTFTSLSDDEIGSVMGATFPGVLFKFEVAMFDSDGFDLYLANVLATDEASDQLKKACAVWQASNPTRLFGSSGEAICTFLDCVNEQKETK